MFALASAPSMAFAQGLVPTMDQQFEFCQDRPLEPEWMGSLPSRENYKRLVIQTIYRAHGLERVVEAGDCSCATRFPSWDAAVQHFNDRYLGTGRNAMRDAEDRYLTRFNELRSAAREICEAAGNW
ncbi:MAG: hypothetical protein AAFQ58_11930 [Pseudomonadota bacterium]